MLPKNFLPIYIKNSSLVRIGSANDGGYILPKILINKCNFLISLGIGDNWDFEKHFSKVTKCKIEAYDYSIDKSFWLKKIRQNLINLVKLKYFKFDKIYKVFQFIDFHIFFKMNNNNKFYLKKIGNKKRNITLKKIVNNVNSKKIFLKYRKI